MGAEMGGDGRIQDIIEAEHEVYEPPENVVESAHVQNWEEMWAEAEADPEAFWAERARELEWYEPWDQVLDDSEAPFYKWFVGAKTNVVHNALDRHLKTWRKNKLALIWEGEDGEKRTFSYYALASCTAVSPLRRWQNSSMMLGARC